MYSSNKVSQELDFNLRSKFTSTTIFPHQKTQTVEPLSLQSQLLLTFDQLYRHGEPSHYKKFHYPSPVAPENIGQRSRPVGFKSRTRSAIVAQLHNNHSFLVIDLLAKIYEHHAIKKEARQACGLNNNLYAPSKNIICEGFLESKELSELDEILNHRGVARQHFLQTLITLDC